MRNDNYYKMDMREMQFVLFEQFKLQDLAEHALYADWDRQTCEMLLDQGLKFAYEKAGPTFGMAEEEEPLFNPEDGSVTINSYFKDAYKVGVEESGWHSVMVPEKYGGEGAPNSLCNAIYEFISGASPTLHMFLGGPGVIANLIIEHGTEEQKQFWTNNLINGKWNGTMVLTEPEVGTDVGAIKTRAIKQEDGSYLIKGNKIFISNGEHDVNENIIHLVLARPEGAVQGSKGLSLFIVPKMRLDGNGETTSISNDIICGNIEDKMGIHGSPTCSLYFGDNDSCQGFILGDGTEGIGLKQMFNLLNEARIATGHMANSQAAGAYYNALAFARERIQSPEFHNMRNPEAPKVPIIKHPDVRRMLLEMKSRTEAGRALVFKLCMHVDKKEIFKESDPEAFENHARQVDLLTPLVKSFLSDQAWRVCELAIQTYGGYGYLTDYPVEQYARNVKILSIYEGTNHVQALDFVGRKLPRNAGEDFRNLIGEIKEFTSENKDHPALSAEVKKLDEMVDLMVEKSAVLMAWMSPEKMALIPANANYILEMVSLITCAWLILDAGIISADAIDSLEENHPDLDFYNGKIASAQFFCRHLLPKVTQIANLLSEEDMSFINIKEESFSTSW